MAKTFFDGIRAAALIALILTFWSFDAASVALEQASDDSGMRFVLVAFGILGLPLLLGGSVLGILGSSWSGWFQVAQESRTDAEALEFRKKVASATLVALPIQALIVAALVAATHFFVTAAFQRVMFQALGLGAIAAVGAVGAGLVWPALVHLVFHTLAPSFKNSITTRMESSFETSRLQALTASTLVALPLVSGLLGALVWAAHTFVIAGIESKSSQATGLLVVVLGAAVLCGALVLWACAKILPLFEKREKPLRPVFGLIALLAATATALTYFWAKGLNVWGHATLLMALVAGPGLVLVFVAMWRMQIRRIAWVYGLPLAFVLLVVPSFYLAGDWASSTQTLREATNRHGALTSDLARVLQKFSDADGDGIPGRFGGGDCDDTNAEIYPGARDTPGNGIDESCSGADSELPQGNDHPSRKAVARAFETALAELKRAEENIPDPPKNLLILLVDTLRVDHLGYAGYERNTSPRIDELARESSTFLSAYATSPHTPRSIPAVFFGKYASRMNFLGAQYNYPRVHPDNTSFAEVLSESGHQNYAETSHHYFQEKRGLNQGFQNWNNDGWLDIAPSNDDIAAPRIWARTEPLIEKLAETQKSGDAAPFTLVVHLFEPHARWIHHKEYDFGKEGDPRVNAYNSEIAYTDAYIGKIIDKFKEQGLWDETVTVLVSDHGEAFNEHGFYFHGQTLYNEVIRVPLIVRVPGWHHRMIKTPVSILDVGPTLLDLLGEDAPSDYDGMSLVPLMLGQEVADRPIFSELLPYTSWKEHHKAVMLGDWKMISVLSAGSEELYNLAEDPGEKKNLIKEKPEDAQRLRKALEEFMNR